jgi:RNA polymerase sigma-70 factor (ECF subfamily)
MDDKTTTTELLRRWHRGDREALETLLVRDLPWIQNRVHQRLGPLLRARAETQDLVQEVCIEFLEYGPRFLPANRDQFCGLLSRIAENVIRGQIDWFTAQRRSLRRECPLPDDSVVHLDRRLDVPNAPSAEAECREWDGLVRLGVELLRAEDRELVLLREWSALSFAEIGKRLGASEDAVRMRFHRAVARLASNIQHLRSGKIDGLLGNDETLAETTE